MPSCIPLTALLALRALPISAACTAARLRSKQTITAAVALSCCSHACHNPLRLLLLRLIPQRLVQKKRWMSEQLYLELFALGGCLPGPTSTQVSFALGTVKKGVLGKSWEPGAGSAVLTSFRCHHPAILPAFHARD